VGFYGEQILPRVIDKMLGTKEFRPVREEVCTGLVGDVVEIGFGSGLNLQYLPPAVTGLWAVDPSGVAMKLAQKRITATNVPVHAAGLNGEHLDLPDDRFNAALSTMTLCTILDATAAVAEVRRVLKPGAVFHFAEHGYSPDAKVARTQDRMNGLQNHIGGGCNLNRPIPDIITGGGFTITALRNFYLRGPKMLGYMYIGTAVAA
jgi:SAM-dependent methyltransferase